MVSLTCTSAPLGLFTVQIWIDILLKKNSNESSRVRIDPNPEWHKSKCKKSYRNLWKSLRRKPLNRRKKYSKTHISVLILRKVVLYSWYFGTSEKPEKVTIIRMTARHYIIKAHTKEEIGFLPLLSNNKSKFSFLFVKGLRVIAKSFCFNLFIQRTFITF